MEIELIAADSLGTRSMAALVRTADACILIDPSVALGPSRYGLPPHRIELERLNEHWDIIKERSKEADVLIITHYHYDHHNPGEPEIFKRKHVIIKHPKEKINKSQRERAGFFLENIKNLAKEIKIADGKKFDFGGTEIAFSPPVFHGTNSKLGYVVEVLIREKGESFLFTSDVEGASIKEQADFIIESNPETVYLDGPLSYMLGYRYSHRSLECAIKSIMRVINKTEVNDFIIDHHLLRDLRWRERTKEVFSAAEKRNLALSTAAEFMGKENEMLEARRKELYERFG